MPDRSPFLICYITDRHALDGDSAMQLARLENLIGQVAVAGVDFIQIREKDLATRDILPLAQAAVDRTRGSATQILVNDRLDIALAARAAGIHLGGQSIPAEAVRKVVRKEFLVGVSCHSLEEALAAEAAGADTILLGHIFDTPSKRQYGPPLGLGELTTVSSQVHIPVLALGGITVERVKSCREAGAAGIAGISLFQGAESIAEVVRKVRRQSSR